MRSDCKTRHKARDKDSDKNCCSVEKTGVFPLRSALLSLSEDSDIKESQKADLYSYVFRAKEREHIELLRALRKAAQYSDLGSHIPAPPTQQEIVGYLSQHIERLFKLQNTQASSFPNEAFHIQIDQWLSTRRDIRCIHKELQHVHELQLTQEIERLYADIVSNKCSKSYINLESDIRAIFSLLGASYNNVGKQNRVLVRLLRRCLKNPAYQLIKYTETHPIVKALHAFCLASYTEPYLLHAFDMIGAPLYKALPRQLQNKSFEEKLLFSHETGQQHGLIKNDRSLAYVVRHGKQLMGALSSTNMGKKIARIFGVVYDPRGEFGNVPGAFFDEKLRIQEQLVTVRNIYTPSPTIGDTVAPEAKGALQGMENRQFMDLEELQKDPYPYVIWCYVNLQNISSLDEAERAKNILKLSEEFPFSFRGISLTADSPFYRGGIVHKGEQHIQKAIQDDHPLDEQYVSKQLDELLHDANFSLETRHSCPGGGYYLPVKNLEEKEKWHQSCTRIVWQAYDAVQQQGCMPEDVEIRRWNWKKKAAFRELIMLGMITLWQQRAAIEARQIGGHVIATNACKENIDRGGKVNACLLWALGGPEKDVFSAFHARALLSRYRLVLQDRVEPMYALLQVMPQKAVQDFLTRIE